MILGVSNRQTRDVDCLFPEIPPEIKSASVKFSKEYDEYQLGEDWFNNGPSSLVNQLPKGWEARQKRIYSGKCVFLNTLGREDLLKTKLFAYCDRTDPDLEDLVALKPSQRELNDSIEWVKFCDGNPKWGKHVDFMFDELKRKLNE